MRIFFLQCNFLEGIKRVEMQKQKKKKGRIEEFFIMDSKGRLSHLMCQGGQLGTLFSL